MHEAAIQVLHSTHGCCLICIHHKALASVGGAPTGVFPQAVEVRRRRRRRRRRESRSG